ncbi:MAG: sigma-54 dependent transcriptional regulator [Planctomycetota bacterium]|nr:sigma-54 dependent transcriptional regulator [Planctomycetota bacterium]
MPKSLDNTVPATLVAFLDTIAARALAGQAVPLTDLKFAQRRLGVDEPWAYTLISAMILRDAFTARQLIAEAARCLAKAISAYGHLRALARKHAPKQLPQELRQFEDRCRQTLGHFDPPIAPGERPVQKLRNVVRRMPLARPRPKTGDTLDALGALIRIGRSTGASDLESRVVELLARMLRGRVLFHRVGDTYLQREPQRVHTLSSWTLHRLERTEELRVHRIRRRPEFWRPEQRRPRGVLVFPIGAGVAALAAGRAFRERDVRAVSTILEYLAACQGRAEGPVASAEPAIAPITPAEIPGLVGSSPAWTAVLEQIWRLGPTPCSVVIRGETGTGKELAARALHMISGRAAGPFVPVNCGAIHPETMHAELFGHVRGAFTGAMQSRTGLVRTAHQGTLFLDEVGDMPPAMQVALLRMLQERCVRPVGGTRDIDVDVRVIAATHVDLERRMADGTFREDLYHRLNVIELDLPPLRARREDIPLLAAHILRRHGHGDCALPGDALAALGRYDWPGNVRELEGLLRAAVLLGDGLVLDPRVIDEALRMRRRVAPAIPQSPAVVDPRAARILDLARNTWVSAPALAEELQVSTRTLNRDLRSLVARGLIVRSGEARACRYRARARTRRDLS